MDDQMPYAWGDGERERIQLNGLRLHWDEYYGITVNDGTWSASRLDDPARPLTAGSAPELRERMREDHARRSWTGKDLAGGCSA
jgi:hypothetical protein